MTIHPTIQHTSVCLTARESQCALYLLKGKTYADIAELLGLSPRTIEFYVNNMKMKLHCKSKSELIGVLFETVIGES